MLLKIIVLIGLAYYLVQKGRWQLGLIALASLWPGVGLLIAIALAVCLLLLREFWAAGVLAALIAWNLVGNRLFFGQ